MPKERITVSIDQRLARAVTELVEQGRAPSVSAWVEDAIEAKAAREHKLIALAAAVAAYEAEHGPITEEEMAEQQRANRAAAAAVRAELERIQALEAHRESP